MNNTIIEVSNLTKKYGNYIALNDLNISIKKNEIFGFLGPSGAGKSTLINVITGQLGYEKGNSHILGISSQRLQPINFKKIGIMSDSLGLYEDFSVLENLTMFGKILGYDKSKILKALKDVDLSKSKDMKIKDLSTGMKVRVELIRALLHEPEILFLDEPTRGLDPVTLRKVHNLILSLREKGMTIFLTTHNMQEASMLCDRIALLNEGSIQLTGSPENICLEYINNLEYRVVLKNGENIVFTNNNVLLSKLIAEDKILTIHTNEPTLEDVFISITGRQLV